MIRNRYLRTVAAATTIQFVILFGMRVTTHAQTAPSPSPATNETSSSGSELQQVTVTGYLIPHVGEGPQPVTSYDQTFISKLGNQQVAAVLQQLLPRPATWVPGVVPGFGFQPGGSLIALKGLLPSDTLVLVDGLRMPVYPFFQFGGHNWSIYVYRHQQHFVGCDRLGRYFERWRQRHLRNRRRGRGCQLYHERQLQRGGYLQLLRDQPARRL